MREDMKRKVWGILQLNIIVLLCVAFSACSSNDISIQNTEGYEVTEETTAAVDSAQTPQKGGVLKIAMHKPQTLNPLLNTDVTVDEVLRLVFEPLFTIDEEMDVVPVLAESYTPSDDGTSVTVSLKSGVKWQDGSSVDANDIIYSLDVLKKAPDDVIYKNAVEGVKDYSKLDLLSVKINYDKPLGGYQYNLCFPVVPENYYKGADTETTDADGYLITDVDNVNFKPVGNGFYAFESYEIMRTLKLKASSNCFEGAPYIDEIDALIVDDKDTEISAYQSGLVDVIAANLTQWGDIGSGSETLNVPYNTGCFEFIGFNNSKSPFSELTFRQAIAYAVSVDGIIDSIYIGNAVKSLTPYSPASMYTSSVGMDSYDYNPENTRTMLSSGDFSAESLKIKVLVNSENSNREECGKQIVNNLNRAGFTASLESVSFDEYTQKIENDDFDIFVGSINVKNNMDLTDFLSSNGSNNYCNFSDSRMDRLLSDVATASNSDKYRQAVSEASKYCSNQLPLIGIGFKSDVLLTKNNICGIKKPVSGNIFANINEWYITNNE
jgi:peptide/nickel transport system substrate-binding protein